MEPKRVRPLVTKALGGVGLAVVGAYAGQAAQFRRNAATVFDVPDPAAPGTAAFARWVEAACAAPQRPGNRVAVLRNGDEVLPAMLDAISSATSTIAFSNYIFWAGPTAAGYADALAERARAGVDVNVLLDAWGSTSKNRDLVARMKRAGVKFSWFRTPHWYQMQRFNYRMHRRILVIDGATAFTGGFGIAEEWVGDAEDHRHWRDTHLRIEGPAARDVLGAFMENWSEATHRSLSGAHLPELEQGKGEALVQISRSSPGHGQAKAEALFLGAVLGARRRLWVTTAYFAPRAAVVGALEEAARRGVDVRLLVNGCHTDKELVRRAGQRSYANLLEAGVRVFEYQRTMMHAKVIVVDDQWSNVGTSNWDNRSLALQEEINCSVTDGGVTAQLEKHFDQDFDDAEEILASPWHGRSKVGRTYELLGGALRHSL